MSRLLPSPDYLPDGTASRSERIAAIGADHCRRQSGEVIASYARSYISTITMDGVSVRAAPPTIHAVHSQGAAGYAGRNRVSSLHKAGRM